MEESSITKVAIKKPATHRGVPKDVVSVAVEGFVPFERMSSFAVVVSMGGAKRLPFSFSQ